MGWERREGSKTSAEGECGPQFKTQFAFLNTPGGNSFWFLVKYTARVRASMQKLDFATALHPHPREKWMFIWGSGRGIGTVNSEGVDVVAMFQAEKHCPSAARWRGTARFSSAESEPPHPRLLGRYRRDGAARTVRGAQR